MTAKVTPLTQKQSAKPSFFVKKFNLSNEDDNKAYCNIMNNSTLEKVEVQGKKEIIAENGDFIVWLEYWEYPEEETKDVQDLDV